MADFQLLIDGELCDAASGDTFDTRNPATGEVIGAVAKGDVTDATRAIEAARRAFDEGPWPAMSGAERAGFLRKIVQGIADRSGELAEMEAKDSGATLRKAQLADIGTTQASFEWFAHCAETHGDTEELEGSPFPPSENYLRYEPYGVCTGIIPWNFPLVMAAWKIAPAIAAGNTCVLKPATFTPVTATILGQIIAEAGLPPGVVNIVPGAGREVGAELASNPMVDKTAFTGSTEVGRKIMAMAAETVKACTLELGGKSANIVLDDADLDVAAAGVLWGTFFHNGQVCESGTRALVHRDVYDDFVNLLAERAAQINLGDPLDMATDLGPLVDVSQVQTVEKYVQLGREQVGEPIVGGDKPSDLPDGLDRDAYYQPTIFADVDNSTTIAQEEIFGPVLSVIPVDSDEHAISIANDSMYGLAGGVFSGNLDRAKDVAAGMRTGTVWINDYHLIDAKRPFGGYKQSGIGRELGRQGFDIYRQVKHVHVNPTEGRDNRFHFQILSPNV